MPKHAPVTDAVSVAAYLGSGFVSPSLCLRPPRLTLAEVCGLACACLPVSQTHGAGEEAKGGRGRALHF